MYGAGRGTPALGWGRAAVGAAWITMLAVAARYRPWRGEVGRLVALWAGPNLVHVFLAHDVALPRYLMAAAALVTMLRRVAVARASRAAVIALAVAIAVVARRQRPPGAILQGRQPPIEYQAVRYLARQRAGPPSVLVTLPTELLRIYVPYFRGRVASVMMPLEAIPGQRARWLDDGRDALLDGGAPAGAVGLGSRRPLLPRRR